MTEPLSLDLNIATQAMARRLFPLGYDLTPHAMTGEETMADLNTGRRLKVFSGASDQTIYADAEINHDARAWHDWAHWRYKLGFDLAGETAAAFVQVRHLCYYHGDGAETVDMAALLLCEIIGQAGFFLEHRSFPVDQVAFARRHVAGYQGLASTIVRALSKPGASDKSAIILARQWHSHGELLAA